MSEDMNRKKNPCVFLDVSTDGDPMERVVIELAYKDKDALVSPEMCSFLLMLFLRQQRILGPSVQNYKDCRICQHKSYIGVAEVLRALESLQANLSITKDHNFIE
ncbi:Peptidyl-prolyl cis-trans isomerase CYP63 [Prunus dulcis]|uniref:Peptidyl-prolyl cis-trans isomerase CYP63 n=1 Tax=Prunus dulcis TaxID=3755 RepID=A0A4Y1S283_PRUDU|nr:Peptidyl-prolyl cis-trans isomerase CYP63 [Prunus dulcis]